jgi:hypothetical protein
MAKFFDLNGKEITSAQFYYDKSINKIGTIIVWDSGKREYRRNRITHNLDGPALINSDGTGEYYIEGKRIPEEHFKLLLDIMKLKGLL